METTKYETDLKNWQRVAEDIRKRKYKNIDGSTREAMMIGLRGFDDITCKQAMLILEDMPKK